MNLNESLNHDISFINEAPIRSLNELLTIANLYYL